MNTIEQLKVRAFDIGQQMHQLQQQLQQLQQQHNEIVMAISEELKKEANKETEEPKEKKE